jgi:hypothetical protein
MAVTFTEEVDHNDRGIQRRGDRMETRIGRRRRDGIISAHVEPMTPHGEKNCPASVSHH